VDAIDAGYGPRLGAHERVSCCRRERCATSASMFATPV
jgi:hypothetical protein